MVRRTLRNAPLEENLEKTLEKLGGDDIIRRKYPELYKAVLNTRERVKAAPLRASGDGGDYIFGTEDSCKIRTLNYTPDTTLSTVSSMEMRSKTSSLAIIGDITDTDTGKSIDGFAVSESDSYTLSAESKTASSSLVSGKSKRFIAKSSFVVITKDANGNNIVKTLDSVMDSQKTAENETIVKEVIVNAPMPIKHPGAEYTAVYYNRGGNKADYYYRDVKFGKDSIDVYMPFSGSAEFNAPYFPDPNNPIVTDDITLEIKNEGDPSEHGTAHFDMKYVDDIKWTVTGAVLSWEFPENWHDVLNKNNLSCANHVDFYCRIKVNTGISGVTVPIVIQSKGDEHHDPSYKKIPYIQILWGCFDKTVLITMENGKALPIEKIKEGDKVMTKDSGVCTVTEVITGTEEKLVHIKTSSMNRIQVSRDHPMLTTEGMINADKLTAGTILITENGNETIESLYLVNYNDTAYNLRLDRDGILIANGFYAGDFIAQNKTKKECRVLSAPQKLEEIQEEFADMISGINQVKKNSL